MPTVSITMPTYKRPDLLPRAVESVLAQSYSDWELIITDDEHPPGESWAYLKQLERREPRVRILINPNEHGQIGNNNFALQQAKGKWIKPLYDDDALRPDCLEKMLKALELCPDVALLCCLADNYVDNKLARPGKQGRCQKLQKLSRDDALLACYMQDLAIGTPVQLIFKRDAIDAGILWENVDGMNSAFDTQWIYRIMATGPTLLLNEALIDQHWGHETGTSIIQEQPELLDADLAILNQILDSMLSKEIDRPPLPVILDALYLIRGTLRLRDRRLGEAIKLLTCTARPTSWGIFFRWWINKLVPGLRQYVARQPVEGYPASG